MWKQSEKGLSRIVLFEAVILFTVFGCIDFGFAQEESIFKEVNLFSMSMEELSQVEVISASRQKQKLGTTSVPMTVVSKEDVHYSGATNLYELLQFSPSIDMLRVDRNRYALGVRGLHEVYSDRTLSLINGRPAENTYNGGSEFLRQPLLMEDIERIEIVRGPGGAAWGANAFNGVINVITKKPEDCLGLLTSTQWNTFGDNYQQFRWAGKEKQWSWRISGGWSKQESSSDALDKSYFSSLINFPFGGEFETRDFSRNSIVDTEFINQISKDTELSFGLGHSHNVLGSSPLETSYPKTNGFEETVRSFAKLQTQLDESTSGYIQWTGNYANTDRPYAMKYDSYENDIESQLTFSPLDDHTTTVGGNIRFTTLEQDHMSPEFFSFTNNPLNECSGGAFVIDRWQVADSLALEGQFRQDYSNRTGADWSTRLAAIVDLNKDIEEHIRVAFARAYRAPRVALRQSGTAPGVFGWAIYSNEDLDNEGLVSYEIGYDRQLVKDVHFSTNLYKQRYSNLIGYIKENGAFPGTYAYTPENNDGADAYGAETEIAWRTTSFSLSTWYAFNKFEDDGKTLGLDTDQQTRSFSPAEHKAGLTGRLILPDGFALNANYKYASWTDASHTIDRNGENLDIPKSNVLDITLSRAFKINKVAGEIMVGVSDIFNETERIVESPADVARRHETPGRIFFARLQIKF